jgi:hypothetical protein
MSGELLDLIYTEDINRIRTILIQQLHLNFSLDESTDKAGHRIVNLSVNVPELASFNLGTFDIGRMSQEAVNLIPWTCQQLKFWTNNQLSRVNSITCDTCNTMRCVEKGLQKLDGMEKAFFLLCTTHGFNLVYEDSLISRATNKAIPELAEWIKDCKLIQRYLKGSPYLLSILREKQVHIYGKSKGICYIVMTRFSSHYFLVRSLAESQEALEEMVQDNQAIALKEGSIKNSQTAWNKKVRSNPELASQERPLCEAEIAWKLIKDPLFWGHCKIFRDLFKPLQEATILSESEAYHLGLVTKAWMGVIAKWKEIGAKNEEIKHMTDELCVKIEKRQKRQRTHDNLELLAYALDPETILLSKEVDASTNAKVHELLAKFLNTNEVHQASNAIRLFQRKQGLFAPGAIQPDIWAPEPVKNPTLFWHYVAQASQPLSELAQRIFSTLANSCLSERAFSAMNWTMDQNRCSLDSERQMKATFIYANNKALTRIEDKEPRSLWNTVMQAGGDRVAEIDEYYFEIWRKGMTFEENFDPAPEPEPAEEPELPSTQSFLRETEIIETDSQMSGL